MPDYFEVDMDGYEEDKEQTHAILEVTSQDMYALFDVLYDIVLSHAEDEDSLIESDTEKLKTCLSWVKYIQDARQKQSSDWCDMHNYLKDFSLHYRDYVLLQKVKDPEKKQKLYSNLTKQNIERQANAKG